MILDFLNEEEFTLTQIHLEINKAKRLYRTLCGDLYRSVLYDEICDAYRILEDRRTWRASQSEIDCYETFSKYGLLKE